MFLSPYWRIKYVCIALFSVFFFFPTVVGGGPVIKLKTLPKSAHTFIIYRHITRIISLSQIELITEMKKGKPAENISRKLDTYLRASTKALQILGDTGSPLSGFEENFPSFDREEFGDVTFTDPTRQARWLKNAERKLVKGICSGYSGPVMSDDEHNFYVFYMYNVQNLCGKTISWRPRKAFAKNPFIKIFFKQGSPVGNTEIFTRGHRYLEEPAHKPFLKGGYVKGIEEKKYRIFIAFYFHYAELALDARHVSMANREFFVRRNDLRREIKGFSLVQKLFSALSTRGLVG